jgi:uncharacterized protein YndB with AHSA1/START domain
MPASPAELLDWLRSPTEVTTIIPAAPEAVFAVLADPETYPEWLAGAQRIRAVDPEFPAPGADFDHSVGPTQAITLDDDSTATAVDAPRRLALEVHAGPMTGEVEFLLERLDHRTLLRLRERTTGALGWAMPALRPLLHLRNKGSLERLRTRFEPLVIEL